MAVTAQRIWQWKVAFYLFLAGVGAGSYVAGVLAGAVGYVEVARVGVALGGPLVLLASLFLIFDLGRPGRFWRVFSRPGSSWISRGSFILLLFGAVGIAHIALWLWPWSVLEGTEGARRAMGIAGTFLAVATAGYTGVLMGVLLARPFWNSGALPLLFLVSAFSTGVGGIWIASALVQGPLSAGALEVLGRYDMLLIIIESMVLFFYLYGTAGRAPHSLDLLLTGSKAGQFWGGVVFVGLVVPLVVESAAVYWMAEGAGWLGVVSALCLLAGGLLLRRAILSAGIRDPLQIRRPLFIRPGS